LLFNASAWPASLGKHIVDAQLTVMIATAVRIRHCVRWATAAA
jgi:hypothetical protein